MESCGNLGRNRQRLETIEGTKVIKESPANQ